MREFRLSGSSTFHYGSLLEKVEILRSALRWASRLERPEIEKLLLQCNSLREEVMSLSRKDRFAQTTHSGTPEEQESLPRTEPGKQLSGQRKQALLQRNFIFEGVFGESPKLLDALEIAERAAPTELPVLIDGESGTGKELLAKVIHANGSRANQPLISVNCGAIPGDLLESELFGHKKGAFTGAIGDRKGKFESAHQGTIFLDEVGELPLPGQVKLLRVLQANEIQRVGSDETISVDTRVVAATNRNLLDMSREGRFREDLYYRLSVIRVTLPPLRERFDEIPLLVEFFCDEAAERLKRRPVKLTARLHGFLMGYSYPGNIRELRNIIFRLSCLADEVADIRHLPEEIRPAVPKAAASVPKPEAQATLSDIRKAAGDEAERLFLENGLREIGGKVVDLAKLTGMNRTYLQELLKKHGLNPRSYRPNSPPKP
jgi:transcriptional regulator with GAF, ATPase, and Fis domain